MKKNDYTRIVWRIENEGFLCIDNRIKPNTNNYDEFLDTIEVGTNANEVGPMIIGTFEVGKIMEMSGSQVCPGEIVSIMNYEEFGKYKNEIKYYRPVLKGKKMRFYKHSFEDTMNDEDAGVIMSGESVIYPPDEEIPMTDREIWDQVNYHLMEPNKCYYATITMPEKKVILTYITSIQHPQLELPDLQHDLVFTHHIQLQECKDALETFTQSKEENGLVFYRNDGQPFEFWTPTYGNIKSQEKHYSITAPEYYIMLLNKYPLGNTYERFFEDLHYDVDIYLQHYPEHIKIFSILRKKLDTYANSSDINKIRTLLNLDKEYDADPKVVLNEIMHTCNNMQ
jgi:hypothetical protein